MSSEEIKKFYEKFSNDTAKMKKQTPGAASGFMALFEKVMKDGEISVKHKELIAISIAVASYCGPCIKLHVKKCLDAGASREEILEAASVAVMMAGGPAFTHIPEVIDALDANEA
jgi:AhpD family alkylhydroperoxidase